MAEESQQATALSGYVGFDSITRQLEHKLLKCVVLARFCLTVTDAASRSTCDSA